MEPKADLVRRVINATMTILYESSLYGSSLWPKYGISVGAYPPLNRLGNHKMDCVCVGVRIDRDSSWQAIRFNIWGKTYGRAFKQYRQLFLLFDKAIHDAIFFEPVYPEITDRMPAHFHDESVMGMLSFKFTIQ